MLLHAEGRSRPRPVTPPPPALFSFYLLSIQRCSPFCVEVAGCSSGSCWWVQSVCLDSRIAFQLRGKLYEITVGIAPVHVCFAWTTATVGEEWLYSSRCKCYDYWHRLLFSSSLSLFSVSPPSPPSCDSLCNLVTVTYTVWSNLLIKLRKLSLSVWVLKMSFIIFICVVYVA